MSTAAGTIAPPLSFVLPPITVVHVVTEGPIGNLLHLVIFVTGAGVLGVTALAVIERLAGGASPPRIGGRHLLLAAGVLALAIVVEVSFHLLGGS